MALTNIRYVQNQPDIVLAVTACPPTPGAGVTGQISGTTPLSGSVSSGSTANNTAFAAQVITAPNESTQPASGYAWGIYNLVTLYPVDFVNGSLVFPDVELRVNIGDKQPNDLILRAGYADQMFPDPRHLRGGRREQVNLGTSLRRLWADKGIAGMAVQNVPLMLAGNIWVPTQKGISFRVASQTGWGQGSTPINPLYILIWMDIFTDEELATLYPWLQQQQSYGVSFGPGGAVAGSFVWPTLGGTPTADVGKFPGGVDQSDVTFELKAATNFQQIQPNTTYIYSNESGIVGANQNNLGNTIYDLGHADKGTRRAFIPTYFGLRFAPDLFASGQPNPQIYVSYTLDNETVPNPKEHGLLIPASTNYLQWGAEAPVLNDSAEFFPMVAQANFVKVLEVGQNLAPQVYSIAAAAYAAGSVELMQGGYRIAAVG